METFQGKHFSITDPKDVSTVIYRVNQTEKEDCKKTMFISIYEIRNARKVIFDKYTKLLNKRGINKC